MTPLQVRRLAMASANAPSGSSWNSSAISRHGRPSPAALRGPISRLNSSEPIEKRCSASSCQVKRSGWRRGCVSGSSYQATSAGPAGRSSAGTFGAGCRCAAASAAAAAVDAVSGSAAIAGGRDATSGGAGSAVVCGSAAVAATAISGPASSAELGAGSGSRSGSAGAVITGAGRSCTSGGGTSGACVSAGCESAGRGAAARGGSAGPGASSATSATSAPEPIRCNTIWPMPIGNSARPSASARWRAASMVPLLRSRNPVRVCAAALAPMNSPSGAKLAIGVSMPSTRHCSRSTSGIGRGTGSAVTISSAALPSLTSRRLQAQVVSVPSAAPKPRSRSRRGAALMVRRGASLATWRRRPSAGCKGWAVSAALLLAPNTRAPTGLAHRMRAPSSVHSQAAWALVA